MDWPDAVDVVPTEEELELAARHPNAFIYRLSSRVKDARGVMPDDAVIGRWRVNRSGRIIGNFMSNPKYDPARWPE